MSADILYYSSASKISENFVVLSFSYGNNRAVENKGRPLGLIYISPTHTWKSEKQEEARVTYHRTVFPHPAVVSSQLDMIVG